MKQHYWQDARLKKALEHAPDRNQKPSEEVREHILRTAAQAVEPTIQKAPKNWARVLTQLFSSQSRMPWNAAWGTALLIVCVGMVWLFQDPKTAFEPQPPAHFPQQPVSTITRDETPSAPASVLAPASEPAPIETQTLADDPISARLDQAAATSLALPTPSTEASELARHAKPRPTPSSQPTITSSLGNPRLPQEQASHARNRQQEHEIIAEEFSFDIPTTPAPATTPTPVTSLSVPSLAAVEEKTQETATQHQVQDITIPTETGISTASTTSVANSASSAENSSSRMAQSAPNAFEQNITGNYDGPLFSSGAGHASSSSASADAVMASVQAVSAQPLSEVFTTALQQWDYLQFTVEGHSYTLHRNESAPLPEILLRMINTYAVVDHPPEKNTVINTFVFYTSDKTALGTLTIQLDGVWSFHHRQQSALTGQLSENQRQQLEEILKTLLTR